MLASFAPWLVGLAHCGPAGPGWAGSWGRRRSDGASDAGDGRLVARVPPCGAVDGDLQGVDQPVLEPIAPAMQRGLLAPAPGIEHDRGLRDMGHLLDGIELAEHVVAPVRGDGRDQLPVA